MRTLTRWLVTAGAVATIATATLSADRVHLKSGKVVDGTFLSADSSRIRMFMDNGSITEFLVEDVASLEFTPRKTPPPSTPPPPSSTTLPAPVNVPRGTTLSVRLTQAIEVDAAKAGTTFKALLDAPVMAGGAVVVPRNASVTLQAVKVEQAGNFKGADMITLKASSLSFGGRIYNINTSQVEQKGSGEGSKTATKMVAGAGLGAAVGAIAGGGTGAAIGAAAGTATGAIVSSQGTEHLKLPAETLLQFTLNAPVSVRP